MKIAKIIIEEGKAFIEFTNGVPGSSIKAGDKWPVHKDIRVPGRFHGYFCEVLEVNQRVRYVRRFRELDSQIKFFKGMNPVPEGKPLTPTEKRSKSKTKTEKYIHRRGKCDDTRPPATAPYNFIPLNGEDEIVHSDAGEVRFDKYGSENDPLERYTGFIDLELVSMSPVYIRGEEEKFFEVDGTPVIPGSTLRGMTRSLVEIVSYGFFLPEQTFENTRFYNRSAFDEKTQIREHYESLHNNVRSGFLNFDPSDHSYYILVSGKAHSRGDLSTKKFKYQLLPSEGRWLVHSGMVGEKEKKPWVIFAPADPPEKIKLCDKDIEDYAGDRTRNTAGEMSDILTKCKNLQRSKDLQRCKFPHGLPVFFTSYSPDPSKPSSKRYAFGHTYYFRMPYRYTVADHIPNSLTHREADDIANSNHREPNDIANAIFGCAGKDSQAVAGRVYFEDAPRIEGGKPLIGFPKILGTPKPTSYQLYLQQNPCGVATRKADLDHWGIREALIRGYKRYWHILNEHESGEMSWKQKEPKLSVDLFGDQSDGRKLQELVYKLISSSRGKLEAEGAAEKIKNVILKGEYGSFTEKINQKLRQIFFPGKSEKETNNKPAMFQPIAPLPTNTRFKGRLRFENLTKVELGALLFVLDLGLGLAHKIGLGKPIGLGSVQITPTLHLSDRQARYTGLFGDNRQAWNTAEQPSTDLEEFKDAFARYVGTVLPKHAIKKAKDLWEVPRIKALETMLKLGHSDVVINWFQRTSYGKFGGKESDFKDRSVLPAPGEFVHPKTQITKKKP